MIVAQKKFIISSSQQRIWELLLKATLRSVPLERMKPISERNIQGLIRVKLGFISLPMNVDIKIDEISSPDSMTTLLKAKGMKGLIQMKQKSIFNVASVDGDKTEVSCVIEEDGVSVFLKIFLLWKVKRFATEVLVNLQNQLRQWA
jgi:hypothetical protein